MKEAGVMLIVKDGLILGISRREDKTIFGLPGGKKEDGETPEEAAIRETWEETSIKVNSCVQIFRREEPARSTGGLPFYTYCYYATDWEGTPSSSEEGEVAWLTAEELTSTKAAFAQYNRNTLDAFKKLYPQVTIKGE